MVHHLLGSTISAFKNLQLPLKAITIIEVLNGNNNIIICFVLLTKLTYQSLPATQQYNFKSHQISNIISTHSKLLDKTTEINLSKEIFPGLVWFVC
jgi:hypothetical protein